MSLSNILTPELLRERYPESSFRGTSKLLFRQALANSPLPVCLTDPNFDDNPIVFVNDAFVELTGYDRADIIGNNCRFLQGENTDPQSIREIRDALAAGEPAVIEIVNYRKDGSEFVNALHLGPIFDVNGNVIFIYGSQWDVTESMTFDQMRRRRALELAGIGVWEYQTDTGKSVADLVTRRLFGVDNPGSDFDASALMENVHPDDSGRVRQKTIDAFKGDVPAYDQDFRVILDDGSVRWLRSHARISEHRDSRRLLGVTQDVTKEKSFELDLANANQRLELAARELDHRIKNLFGMVSSLINMTARSEEDPAEALKQAINRVNGLADVHSLTNALRKGEEVSLNELVNKVLEPYETGQDIIVTGDRVDVHADHVPSLGLIFHELITNSVKHGALGSKDGQLTVSWVKRLEKLYLINWIEKGHSDNKADLHSSGLGTRLMEISAKQIGGSFMSDLTYEGLRVSILIPASPSEFD